MSGRICNRDCSRVQLALSPSRRCCTLSWCKILHSRICAMSITLEVLPRLVLVPRCAAAAPSLSPRRCLLPELARGKKPVSLKILCFWMWNSKKWLTWLVLHSSPITSTAETVHEMKVGVFEYPTVLQHNTKQPLAESVYQ
jgi:hypothetical protein